VFALLPADVLSNQPSFRWPMADAKIRQYPEQRRQRLGEVARRIANATEAVQDGRIYIEKINGQFLFKEGGTPAE